MYPMNDCNSSIIRSTTQLIKSLIWNAVSAQLCTPGSDEFLRLQQVEKHCSLIGLPVCFFRNSFFW